MTTLRKQDIEFMPIETEILNEIMKILDYSNFGLPGEFFINDEIAW